MGVSVSIQAVRSDHQGSLIPMHSERDYSMTPGQLVAYHLSGHRSLPSGVTFEWVVGYDPVGEAIRARKGLPGSQCMLSSLEIQELEQRVPTVADCHQPADVLRSVHWLLALIRSGDLPTRLIDFVVPKREQSFSDWNAVADEVRKDLAKFIAVAERADEAGALLLTRTHA